MCARSEQGPIIRMLKTLMDDIRFMELVELWGVLRNIVAQRILS